MNRNEPKVNHGSTVFFVGLLVLIVMLVSGMFFNEFGPVGWTISMGVVFGLVIVISSIVGAYYAGKNARK